MDPAMAEAETSDPQVTGGRTEVAGLPRGRNLKEAFSAIWQWLKTSGNLFSDINGTVWAASFSYYAFFALVPLAIMLVTLTTDFAARFIGEQAAQTRAFDYIVANIPLSGQARILVSETLHGVLDARGKIGLVALVGLLWSSLGFFQSLVSSVNQAFRQQPINWWKLPLEKPDDAWGPGKCVAVGKRAAGGSQNGAGLPVVQPGLGAFALYLARVFNFRWRALLRISAVLQIGAGPPGRRHLRRSMDACFVRGDPSANRATALRCVLDAFRGFQRRCTVRLAEWSR